MVFAKKLLFLLCGFCFFFTSSYAETPSQQQPFLVSSASSSWQFDIAPYLWAINMNGRIEFGNQILHNDQSFSDLLQQLNWGGMLWLGAHYKENWGFFLDSVYASLSSEDETTLLTISSRNHFGVFTGGVSYKAFSKNFNQLTSPSRIELEPYLGARYTVNDTTMKFNSLQVVDNKEWVDPIIGLHMNYVFAKRWSVVLMGDIGGTNANSDASYNLVGALGFQPAIHATVYLGYRDLYQHYTTGRGRTYYDWQMRIFGPILGINFLF